MPRPELTISGYQLDKLIKYTEAMKPVPPAALTGIKRVRQAN